MNDKDNLYQCEHCTIEKYGKGSKKTVKSAAITRSLIYEPPKNLVINLKRFVFGGYSLKKDKKPVHFPILLNIDKYCMH